MTPNRPTSASASLKRHRNAQTAHRDAARTLVCEEQAHGSSTESSSTAVDAQPKHVEARPFPKQCRMDLRYSIVC
ncbi:unnamed protein product [Zymoseptoria tritici ST99CH_3D7]|uniref:Uncharacterized protein n=1 Tax=Zymoseptoria tritici (strain ST99CH_3D7) TaxID=1276538 RepID=A0A1X7S769_ZYMT9|nr:unnamed protein product [Zymoseptoria tritici ST99CH_3D7]